MATPIRFHLDEHIAPAVATGLARRGIDVTTAAGAGLIGADDLDHIAFGLRERRVIVTHHRDFPRHHANGVRHGGIAYTYQSKYGIGEFISALRILHCCMTAEEMDGVLEFL
jgi:hypothetical protein